MRIWPWALLLCVLSLACATPYVINLKNGDVVETLDEPDYDDDTGFYEFEDHSGRRMRMNKDAILSMEAR